MDGVIGEANAVDVGILTIGVIVDIVTVPDPGVETAAAAAIVAGRQALRKVATWTSTKSSSAVKNAFRHFKKHKRDFPEFQNSKQYVEGAHKFLNNPPKGTLTKRRPNGDTLHYEPRTNTFGVKDANGVPKTMFRPKDGIKYWNNQ